MAGLGNPAAVTFIGADFNAPGTEPTLPGQNGQFYDPEPYPDQQPGLPHQLYQVAWDDNPDAPPVVDRRAMERLRRAGLIDVAWHLHTPWTPTTGHHPADPHGNRRPDAWGASTTAKSPLSPEPRGPKVAVPIPRSGRGRGRWSTARG
jgi:hypothetical protein